MRRRLRFRAGLFIVAALALAAGGGAQATARGSLAGQLVAATNGGGTPQLVLFHTSDPRKVQTLTVIGLAAGEVVVGLDVRPDTGALYAKAKHCLMATCTGTSQLYVVQLNERAGTATFSPTGAAFPTDGSAFGFDFNPTVDRVRVVSETAENRRVHPDTGAPTADTALRYVAGDANAGKDPDVAGAAYLPAAFGGTTTLYDVDAKQDVLAIQSPANDGLLRTVGGLGVDTTTAVGFDIVGRNSPRGFAALQPVGQSSRLYRIDLGTGRARELGTIGVSAPVDALAVLDR